MVIYAVLGTSRPLSVSTTPVVVGGGLYHEFDNGWQFTWDLAAIAERQLQSTLHGFNVEERELLNKMVRGMKSNTCRSPHATTDPT